MDEYAEEKRTEKNLIVRSGISEAKTTNNKRLDYTRLSRARLCRDMTRLRRGGRGLARPRLHRVARGKPRALARKAALPRHTDAGTCDAGTYHD